MLIKKSQNILSSEITDQAIYQERRKFMTSSIGLTAAATLLPLQTSVAGYGGQSLKFGKNTQFNTTEEKTSFDKISNYNNFYEFGTDKYSPAKNAQALTTDPWSVQIDGEVEAMVKHIEETPDLDIAFQAGMMAAVAKLVNMELLAFLNKVHERKTGVGDWYK